MSRKDILEDKRHQGARPVLEPAGESEQEEKSSDIWWNVIYFLILTTAITFVLVNNRLPNLLSLTGGLILAVLVILDLFPVVYLARVILRKPGERR